MLKPNKMLNKIYTFPTGTYFHPNVNIGNYIGNVIIDKDEKKYPTGYDEEVSGPNVSKVKYEEEKNKHVCIRLLFKSNYT